MYHAENPFNVAVLYLIARVCVYVCLHDGSSHKYLSHNVRFARAGL